MNNTSLILDHCSHFPTHRKISYWLALPEVTDDPQAGRMCTSRHLVISSSFSWIVSPRFKSPALVYHSRDLGDLA
ncbi:hypothetical protein CY34DRAFT_807168 [Suillus luteus UH-Slu-Lm8-n1]|uniref:Uncharacterized protein n=1 Tax=Suillus luteus UH-Slu-Lm8-n1 TaxID=930992 RepID=A0A0D0AFK8_9AGAM|nr:hypothetical protein CY34DRAFT_807168 [Suillus luteus UH-Slu-Lm8-n1]